MKLCSPLLTLVTNCSDLKICSHVADSVSFHLDVFMFDDRHPHGMALDSLSPGATRVGTASFLKKKMVIETKDFGELRKQSACSATKRKEHGKLRKVLRKKKSQLKPMKSDKTKGATCKKMLAALTIKAGFVELTH